MPIKKQMNTLFVKQTSRTLGFAKKLINLICLCMIIGLPACESNMKHISNQPPQVNAGNDQLVEQLSIVKLFGSAVDPDGDIVDYIWQQTKGVPVQLIHPRQDNSAFITPETSSPLMLVFNFSATDNTGATRSDDTQVIIAGIEETPAENSIASINPLNNPPIANAGANQLVDELTQVILSGSASDSDGEIIEYFWQQTAGPTVTLNNAEQVITTFTAPAATTPFRLNFKLTVTDNAQATHSSYTRVIVNPINLPPLVFAGDDQLVDELTMVTLSATATDPDGNIEAYLWQQTVGPSITLSHTAQSLTTFTAPKVNTPLSLVFSLSATDEGGATRTDDLHIMVNPLDTPPLIQAGDNQLVNELTPVTLQGTTHLVDATVASYLWQQIAGPSIAITNTTQATATFTAPSTHLPLLLDFALTATDETGLTYTDETRVIVNPVNIAPTLFAGDDQLVDELSAVTLTGIASDPDGDIISHRWQQTAGPQVTLEQAEQMKASFTTPETRIPLVLSFSFNATDDTGITRTDNTRVMVNPVNAIPTVFAGEEQLVSETSPVQLNGSAEDSDGNLDKILWQQLAGTPVTLVDFNQLTSGFVAPTVLTSETLNFALSVIDNEGARATSEVVIHVVPSIGAGFRYSNYGPPFNPGPVYWANVGQQMATKYPSAKPRGIWIVGHLSGNQTRLSFPGTSSDQNISFIPKDHNEGALTLFDQSGIEVWLQVEPGNASVEELIRLVLNQYSQHPSVIGIGVDVEWYRNNIIPNGQPVTDQEAQTWLSAIQSFKPEYRLFLKHWLVEKMPPSQRDNIVFINDSQQFTSMEQMIADFATWGEHFSTTQVGFQLGYESDRPWWVLMDDPAKEIGNQILIEVPNTRELYWVDFTVFQVFPP